VLLEVEETKPELSGGEARNEGSPERFLHKQLNTTSPAVRLQHLQRDVRRTLLSSLPNSREATCTFTRTNAHEFVGGKLQVASRTYDEAIGVESRHGWNFR
jgi:hypothetical protein